MGENGWMNGGERGWMPTWMGGFAGLGNAVLILGRNPEFVALFGLEALDGQIAEAGTGALLPLAAGFAFFDDVAEKMGIFRNEFDALTL